MANHIGKSSEKMGSAGYFDYGIIRSKFKTNEIKSNS